MIKKLPMVCFLSLPFYAYSAVESMELPFMQNVAPQSTSYLVALDGLKEKFLYKLTCDLTNSGQGAAKFMLEPRLLSSTHYANVQLNNQPLENNTGALQQGENQLSFQVLVEKADFEKYNRFVLTPLSEESLQINQCSAREITPSKLRNIQETSDGGFFLAYNDTDKQVTITVGSFLPTPYVIKSHDYRIVFVSSDNQNIHIKQID